MKFYKCQECGNILHLIEGNNNKIKCCNKEMEELIANTVEASTEKHIPVYVQDGSNIQVTVGSNLHPMTEEHYISFIAQVSNNEINIVKLKPTSQPTATFKYTKNSQIYAYCNLHGLWSSEVK